MRKYDALLEIEQMLTLEYYPSLCIKVTPTIIEWKNKNFWCAIQVYNSTFLQVWKETADQAIKWYKSISQ